jgi:hypothetical protein
VYAFLICPMRSSCVVTVIISGEEYKLWSC